MAAGMGSRYGGLKQMDPVGNRGQVIVDYSLYDARRAGFETVVFIITHEMDEAFRAQVGNRVGSRWMLARLIAQAEAEVRQAKDEYAALLQNNDDRTTVQQIRSYYDEFLGWANEFSLATVERKRVILAQLFEKVEVGKGYKITIHVRGTYRQFLREGDSHGEL